MKNIAVIIPCRNEVIHIEKTIDHIFGNDYPMEHLRVIVVDGKSTDGTAALLETLSAKHRNLRIVENPAQYTPVAFNIGIREAQKDSDYVVIVGARHVLQKNYLSACISSFSIDPMIRCTGGRSVCHFNNQTSKAIAMAMSSPFGVGGGTFRSQKYSGFVDTVTSAMYPLQLFDEIGLFNEDLIRNQDDELNFRLTEKGYKIYMNADTEISYFARGSYRDLFKQHVQYGYWKVYVNTLHQTITTVRQLFPALFMLFLTAWIPLLALPYFPFVYFFVLLLYVFLGLLLNQAKDLKEKVSVLYAVFLMHSGYGIGYLQGLFHFLVLHKKPSGKHKQLTR